MKTYKNLYEKCLEKDTIKAMILKASQHKRSRRDVKRALGNIEQYTERVYSALVQEEYEPKAPSIRTITEGTRRKVRQICSAGFFDHVIQHLAVNACYEVFNHSMYVYCCGSVPKRGITYARKRIERWIRNDYKNTKYCTQMDIHHYFESIDKELLKEKLARKIKDKRMMRLLCQIIDSYAVGIPLGYYTSQWFANFLLEELDHYIKEQLKVKYYVRYLDDMVMFGRNKKELHKARAAIAEYLQNNLNLKMKGNYQTFRLSYTDRQGKERGRALDFLGFRFYRNKTTLRRSLMYKITRKVARASRKDRPNANDAASVLSYMGWLKASNSYGLFLKYIKGNVDIKQLKKIVSRKGAERSGKNQVETDRGNAGRKTERN